VLRLVTDCVDACSLLLLQWANMSMTVRGKQYKMLRMHFMPRCKANGA
jgi:hypothetical protein